MCVHITAVLSQHGHIYSQLYYALAMITHIKSDAREEGRRNAFVYIELTHIYTPVVDAHEQCVHVYASRELEGTCGCKSYASRKYMHTRI